MALKLSIVTHMDDDFQFLVPNIGIGWPCYNGISMEFILMVKGNGECLKDRDKEIQWVYFWAMETQNWISIGGKKWMDHYGFMN